MVAPKSEVIFPATLTGIFTIGLNVFALASDVAISGYWAAVRGDIEDLTNDLFEAIESLGNIMTPVESLGMAVTGGYATYTDVAHGDTNNLWSLVLSIASMIPKLLFTAKSDLKVLVPIAAKIIAVGGGTKIADAIPIIGEVLGVLSLLGDLATLSEVSQESAIAPWVIENEISLQYSATINIKPDHRNAGGAFPETATAWTLTAQLDGANALDAISGTINEGGHVQTSPLVVTTTAPFGGKTMKWSIVFTDQYGFQVGTGASHALTNDDPDNPPTSVEFEITELPEQVDASTIFKRADTITYSSTAGGYTWSNLPADLTDNGTARTSPIQQIVGATVSTLAGVAGVVWKQNDRYFLRGIPTTDNSGTLDLQPTKTEGFARPPFLLFDPFADPTDQNNHVLLEPVDDISNIPDAYIVRAVTLDTTTGAISWDPTAAHGMFSLPVSAAAIHPSGHVVTVHTDTGRVGRVSPALTPQASVAAYSGGVGTEIGLLQSPTSVAVTNPGMILILEAGAAQISAFDLNGNPVQYFGSGSTLQYTLPLDKTNTYLDLAVDGSSQIYLLYHTGDGSQPDDYHVDVLTASGEPLATHSPGVNVGKLAVDYWRSIYGVNFDPITDEGTTNPHIDPALKVLEPSLSRFDPTPGAGA
jgi:hypothetical protein